MHVLIVESDAGLAWLWRRHIERDGAEVTVAASVEEAIAVLQARPVEVILLDLTMPGGPLSVADYASYRHPRARVVCVTRQGFFSDGSIFGLSPNAAAVLGTHAPPEDIAAVVDYHGRAA